MYGLHINSDPNTISAESNKYKNLNVLQLFLNTNDKYKTNYIDFKKTYLRNNQCIIIHLSYTINIAQKWDEYSWWITQCLMEINIAHNIGAKYVVLHFGKSLDIDINNAINNMYTTLLYLAHETKTINIKILLETSSGQGSEMCYTIDELARFVNKLLQNKNKNISNKFGICIDTCHIFNAGYNLNTKNDVVEYLRQFDNKIGLKHIKLIHLNNSKTEINSRIDRHENLEYGKIDVVGIKEIISFAKKLDIPIILETPDKYIEKDIEFMNNNYKVL